MVAHFPCGLAQLLCVGEGSDRVGAWIRCVVGAQGRSSGRSVGRVGLSTSTDCHHEPFREPRPSGCGHFDGMVVCGGGPKRGRRRSIRRHRVALDDRLRGGPRPVDREGARRGARWPRVGAQPAPASSSPLRSARRRPRPRSDLQATLADAEGVEPPVVRAPAAPAALGGERIGARTGFTEADRNLQTTTGSRAASEDEVTRSARTFQTDDGELRRPDGEPRARTDAPGCAEARSGGTDPAAAA